MRGRSDRGEGAQAPAGGGGRARLPRGLGLEGVPGVAERVRHPAASRAAARLEAAAAHLHPGHEGGGRDARREHHLRAHGRRSSARRARSRCATSPSGSTRRRRSTRSPRASSSPTPSSSSAWTRHGRLHLIDEALTPDSSRFWPLATLQGGREPGELRQAVRAQLARLDRLRAQASGAGRAARGGAEDLGEVPGGAAGASPPDAAPSSSTWAACSSSWAASSPSWR